MLQLLFLFQLLLLLLFLLLYQLLFLLLFLRCDHSLRQGDDDGGWDKSVPPDSRRWMWGCVASPNANVGDPVSYCMGQKYVPYNVTESHLYAVISARDAVVDFQHVCDVSPLPRPSDHWPCVVCVWSRLLVMISMHCAA